MSMLAAVPRIEESYILSDSMDTNQTDWAYDELL